jgi:predicted dehydrogenase
MSDLRVAIAGTGFIGRVHARSARLAGATLVGVSASTPERGEDAAKQLGAERSFASAEELVVADDIDVVHICTPNHLHAPLAKSALEAGKHVVCEKPLAMSSAEAEELVQIARGVERVASVPFVYRFYATVREAKARVESGELGDINLIHGTYLQDWLLNPDDSNWRVDSAQGGASRAFADIGSHWCDLTEFVSGHRITHVTAQLLTAFSARTFSEHQEAFASSDGGDSKEVTTEDAATVMFRTDRGAVGTVVISQISGGRKNRLWFELDGTQAAVAFDQENPETLWLGKQETTEVLTRSPENLSKAAAPYATLPGGHPLGYHDCFDLFVAETYDAITNGLPEGLPGFEDGLRAAKITDAVLLSAREQRTVEVK